MNVIAFIALCLVILNLIGFAAMGIDKWKAKKQLWRIPEATLFTIAIIGGSIGCLLGMYLFCHKTRKWQFAYGMPAILFLQLLVLFLLSRAPFDFIFL